MRNLVDFTQISLVKSTQNYKSKCFSTNSSVWWMQGGGYDQGFHPWNLVDFNHEIWWISPRFHLWNPPKIIKASVSAKTLQFDECRVGAMTKDFTYEIQQISPTFHLWNPPKIIKASVSAKTLQFDECKVGAMTKDFIKSTGFHMKSAWNPLDFKIMSFCVMIKYRSFIFQKTNQKSFCWNIWLVFWKSKDLYLIITQKIIIWNPADFTMKSGGFHLKSGRFHHEIHPEPYKFRCFSKKLFSLGGFHLKSARFHLKSAGFHLKSAGFHMDFMKSSRFHVKSTQNLINSDVSAKTLQFGWISPEIRQISWNLPDFIRISWNPADFIRISCEIERPLARNCNPMFWNVLLLKIHLEWYVHFLSPALMSSIHTEQIHAELQFMFSHRPFSFLVINEHNYKSL